MKRPSSASAGVGGRASPKTQDPGPDGGESAVERFDFGDLAGEVVSACRPAELERDVRRLIDPASALESLHWGRNYLYRAELETPAGPLAVAVKQFREEGLRSRLLRRSRGSKAARSFRVARAMLAAGVPTPEPVLRVDSTRPRGPSFYVCRHLPGVLEARYLLRAARAGRAGEEFPEVDLGVFLAALGRRLRRLHDAGILHRDASVGNVLLRPRPGGRPPEIWLVDLNRARTEKRPGLLARSRDLSRLALVRRRDQDALLAGYWGADSPGTDGGDADGGDGPGRVGAGERESAGGLRRAAFLFFQQAFEAKQRIKAPLAGLRRALAVPVRSRRPHPHIPPAPAGASRRDRSVWDPLSDQPHQHAGRAEKLLVRLADLPSHLEGGAALAAAAPRIVRRYRRLRRRLYAEPVPFGGAGVALRPLPGDPEGLLKAVDELGARRVLLRLHPWQREHGEEEELARELARRGYELAFALPQNRELVRDPELWRAAVTELAERFVPYGRHFQVGQAINRSKWGIWRLEEYVRLAVAASEVLRRHPGVEVLGPAVIDFEPHAAATVLNLRREGLHFDAVASLLYVDRRGAPEKEQLGFDTVGKTVLLRAIAETARNCAPRCWITEVNWPLAEGPHAPAGRGVAVDEESQANYLARYHLLTLSTGLVERVYWWQLVARGYGLIRPGDGGALARRPAYRALATLVGELDGATSLGPLEAPAPGRLFRFRRRDGGEVVAGWSAGAEPVEARLPARPTAVVDRDGEALPAPDGDAVTLFPRPRYFHLER